MQIKTETNTFQRFSAQAEEQCNLQLANLNFQIFWKLRSDVIRNTVSQMLFASKISLWQDSMKFQPFKAKYF